MTMRENSLYQNIIARQPGRYSRKRSASAGQKLRQKQEDASCCGQVYTQGRYMIVYVDRNRRLVCVYGASHRMPLFQRQLGH